MRSEIETIRAHSKSLLQGLARIQGIADLLERFERTGEDVDLEQDPERKGAAPDEIAEEMGTASETDLE